RGAQRRRRRRPLPGRYQRTACADPAHGTPAYLSLTSLVEKCQVKHRSEEHTSELQSQSNLVCRLLLEKKKKKRKKTILKYIPEDQRQDRTGARITVQTHTNTNGT